MTLASAAQERPVRVLVADDHPLILAAVCRAFTESGGFEIVGQLRSGSMVLPYAARTRPDLVLLDVGLPGIDGLACLERLRARDPELDVVMFSASCDSASVDAAREAGARAFIVKTLGAVDLAAAVREALWSSEFRLFGEDLTCDDSPTAGLSQREVAMLGTLARGLSNKAIGRELWITEQTVKFHLTNIYRKLGVESRTQAVCFAYERGLVRS